MLKKVLYPSVIESGNLGDILINSLFVRELSKSNIVLLKGDPPVEMLNLIYLNNPNSSNIKILNFNNKYYILRKLDVIFTLIRFKPIKYVFDTPGHISYKSSIIKTILKESFEICKILLYRLFGVKYLKFGITLGPFRKIEWKAYQIICRICFMIGVRDKENFDYLKMRNFNNLKLVPDLAFLLCNNSILNSIQKTNKNNSITISLRGSLKGKDIDKDYTYHTIRNSIELIKSLLIYNQNINTINIAYQVDCDQILLPIIEKEILVNIENINIILHKNILSFETAKILYSSSNYIITNRLHVFLFAMNLATISFIVTDIQKHKKLISIIHDLNLNSLIYSNLNTYSLKIEDELESFKNTALCNRDKLIDAISEL